MISYCDSRGLVVHRAAPGGPGPLAAGPDRTVGGPDRPGPAGRTRNRVSAASAELERFRFSEPQPGAAGPGPQASETGPGRVAAGLAALARAASESAATLSRPEGPSVTRRRSPPALRGLRAAARPGPPPTGPA
eukprot:177293-Hanusia_phi.AAC.2